MHLHYAIVRLEREPNGIIECINRRGVLLTLGSLSSALVDATSYALECPNPNLYIENAIIPILDFKADVVNIGGDANWTPLYRAASFAGSDRRIDVRSRLLNLFIAYGADVNAVSQFTGHILYHLHNIGCSFPHESTYTRVLASKLIAHNSRVPESEFLRIPLTAATKLREWQNEIIAEVEAERRARTAMIDSILINLPHDLNKLISSFL